MSPAHDPDSAPMNRRRLMLAVTLGASSIYTPLALAAAGVPPLNARSSPVEPSVHRTTGLAGRRLLVKTPGDGRTPAPNPPAALTEADFNSCRKPAPGKRVVQVPLKPDTDVEHLIVWISSITCKAFVWSGDIAASRKRVTVDAPRLVTPKQAFRLFLDALNSVGLTVLPAAGFYQVIDTFRAKTKPIPLYDWDGKPLTAARP